MNELIKTTDYSSIVEAYLRQKDVSERSKRTYNEALKMFFKWTNEKGLAQLTKADIIEYKVSLKDRGLKAFSINLYLTTLRGFFDWTEEEKIHPDVARRVRGEKVPKGFKKNELTLDQANELVNSIKNKRNKALIFLMIGTGLRSVETTRADVKDVQPFEGKMVLFVQGKGHAEKDGYVVLKAPVLRELEEYLVDRRAKPEQPLFTSESRNHRGERLNSGSVSRIVKQALRGIRLDDERTTCHSLRHTMVTFSKLGGASPEAAQAGARHEQAATTALYDHSRNDLQLKDEAATAVLEYMGVTV